jgi:hypothetical protein
MLVPLSTRYLKWSKLPRCSRLQCSINWQFPMASTRRRLKLKEGSADYCHT